MSDQSGLEIKVEILVSPDDDHPDDELKLQDHHQLNVHIPEGHLIQSPANLDPILESSTADLHADHPDLELTVDNIQVVDALQDLKILADSPTLKEVNPSLKSIEKVSSSSDEALRSYNQSFKDEIDDDQSSIKKKKSFTSQRAVWHGHTTSESPFEIPDSSNLETLNNQKKPTLLKKLFKLDTPLGDFLSNSFNSKHDSQSIRQESTTHSSISKHDDQDSIKSNHSINANSGNYHQFQMVHFPESQSREHWVTNNHRDHKHESLFSKIFHVKHEPDHEHKSKDHEENNSSSRASRVSACEETMQTSSSSVEYSSSNIRESRASVGSDLRKILSSPPPDFPKTDHSISNTLARLLSKKKRSHEDREITSTLIKELMTDQYQIQRTDTENSQMTNNSFMSSAADSDVCLADKYGHLEEVLGKGAQATVRLAHLHKANAADKLWAVKEFRKRKKDETNRDYAKRVISEFCISSSMKHENVIETVDLIKDEHGKWCEVMEYIPGGDMFNKISKGKFHSSLEIACFFKQFLSGLSYIHSIGIAHRDLKPENILLDAKHELIKITDFGVADVVKGVNDKENKLSRGIAGSDPYIAPEMWELDEYDALKTDAWSAGILLYTMYTKTILWRAAKSTDEGFKAYKTRKTDTFIAIEKLPHECRKTMYKLLEPDPEKRLKVSQVLDSNWMENTEKCSLKCTASSDGSKFMHHHNGPG